MYASILGWVLRYVLPGLLVVLAYASYQVYDFGKRTERGVWMEAAKIKAEEHALEVEELAHQAELDALAHQVNLEGIQNAKKEAIEKLEHDVATIRARGLFVAAKSCGKGGTETVGPSEPSGGAGRERLHEETERNLITLTGEADQVVSQYEACRSFILEHVEVID